MSFPYTQCISGITIPAGSFINTTFVVAAYQSGISVGQFTPNPIPPNYTLGGVSNLDNSGASTTAIEFLLDYSNTNYPPPYYFVYGSEDENIWLNSINPATGSNQFTSSNVTTQISKHSQPDAPIAAFFYYVPKSYLYVAASNGNLYWYSVTWSNGVPSLSYVGSNTSYTGQYAVSLTFLPANTVSDYDCLLLGGVSEATGVIFNAANPSSTPCLYSVYTNYQYGAADMSDAYPILPSAVCRVPNGLYLVSQMTGPGGQLFFSPYGSGVLNGAGYLIGFDAQNPPIWIPPSDQIILSLAYSPNAGQADGSNYPDGAVFIATAPSNPGNSSMGSMWVCDVNTNRVGNAAQQSQSISGSPWATIADANLNYLCATGSSGVFHSTLAAYSPSSSIPENGMLVANDPTSGVHREWISDIVSAAALVFGVVTDDPVAVGWAITGIVAGAVDSKTGY
ncbi:MAG: hypothetical protein GPJ17_06580 [Microcystis aeruginosa K13-07]|nr:hypothetical protein [Microcystis aeruginosa K13-07]